MGVLFLLVVSANEIDTADVRMTPTMWFPQLVPYFSDLTCCSSFPAIDQKALI